MKNNENSVSYLLLSPFLLVFFVFLIFPVLYSLWISVHKVSVYSDLYNIFGDMFFVGLSNYISLLKDFNFWWSLALTFIYAAMCIPGSIALALGLAMLLTQSLPGRMFFRSAFFLPFILDMLVVGFVWQLIYAPGVGFLTEIVVFILQKLSLNDWAQSLFNTGFLEAPLLALPSISFAMVLKGAGFGMILFMASLNNIPTALFEAASIDGANRWEIFFNITLPHLSPTILFLIITGVMGALNGFTEIYAMTNASGGPQAVVAGETVGATRISGFYLYQIFIEGRYGVAAAMSYLLFIVAAVVSFINFKLFSPEKD
jgi:ABC-type sugar transport system permease subunit